MDLSTTLRRSHSLINTVYDWNLWAPGKDNFLQYKGPIDPLFKYVDQSLDNVALLDTGNI